MDKNAIKKYATWARRELIQRVAQRAAKYEITKDYISDPETDILNDKVLTSAEKKERKALIEEINKKGYEEVIEEVAYTWFNRFCALRFMEVNAYLPSYVRVFTDEENQFHPQILAEAIHLEMEGLDQEKVYELKEANEEERLYKYLIITQCNALNRILPKMFQKIDDYTELLFPDYLLREGSVIHKMIEMIPEDDWKNQVQIIGWMYQYYNTELKEKADADVKRGKKITKDNLPEKTQIFTPDWIVRYMVENSLGRIWLEGHPNDNLQYEWKYYLNEGEQESQVQIQLEEIQKDYSALLPKQIKCIDPCCGSGHICTYMFDVLIQIYEQSGYTVREAVANIIENNLYGLDVDERAVQLAYFSVMMKARQYDRRFFSHNIQPHIYAIQESNDLDTYVIEYFCDGNLEIAYAMKALVDCMMDAKEYGSILRMPYINFDVLDCRIGEIQNDISIYKDLALEQLVPLIRCAEVMSECYDVVITNPLYLGLRNMGAKTLTYIQNNYPNSKNDFFAVFIDRCIDITKSWGKIALVTAESWLSLSSFEKIRMRILSETLINSMAHLGEGAFDAGFGTVAFSLTKGFVDDYIGVYYKLNDFDISEEKEKIIIDKRKKYCYYSKQKDFLLIPGASVSYWVSQKLFDTFVKYTPLGKIAEPRQGLTTCNNDRFMRLWYEVIFKNIKLHCKSNEETETIPEKWYPYNKGGEPRKWYGNNDYVVNWRNNGAEVKAFVASKYVSYTRTVKNISYYFRKGLTWSAIAKKFAVRSYEEGFIFADKGQAVFTTEDQYYYICGLLNSKYTDAILAIISPTLDFNCGYIKKIPIEFDNTQVDKISMYVRRNIGISQQDWDSFETSWDFKKHPLVKQRCSETHAWKDKLSVMHILSAYKAWEMECNVRFTQLKQNEEELNRTFIDIYGLQEELTPEVEDKDITVRKADLERDIRSFISYAVGCMFGRYSLDQEGLIYAGGEWNPEQYKIFPVDKDNIIPICDDEYFEDDIVGLFIQFVKTVYGEETLEENLKFIADALGGKGSPKEVIRNYFIKDFYKDHCKIYQKRPIYWLFDSGKKNGFKALIYMHRYQPDTIARIRTDYVHQQQSRYRTALEDLERRMEDADTRERVKLNKKLKVLKGQMDEIHEYEEKIHHLADQMISIDLDDGVKKNYAKFQEVLAKIK